MLVRALEKHRPLQEDVCLCHDWLSSLPEGPYTPLDVPFPTALRWLLDRHHKLWRTDDASVYPWPPEPRGGCPILTADLPFEWIEDAVRIAVKARRWNADMIAATLQKPALPLAAAVVACEFDAMTFHPIEGSHPMASPDDGRAFAFMIFLPAPAQDYRSRVSQKDINRVVKRNWPVIQKFLDGLPTTAPPEHPTNIVDHVEIYNAWWERKGHGWTEERFVAALSNRYHEDHFSLQQWPTPPSEKNARKQLKAASKWLEPESEPHTPPWLELNSGMSKGG